jgi:hypothetical protein
MMKASCALVLTAMVCSSTSVWGKPPSVQLPRTQRLLSDPARRAALSRSFQRALCVGGVPEATVSQLATATKRVGALVTRDSGHLLTGGELNQLYQMTGMASAVGQAAELVKRHRDHPVVRKLGSKLSEIKSWPEERRRTFTSRLGARFKADAELKLAYKGIRNGTGNLGQLGDRALGVARECLVRDFGFTRPEANKLSDIACAITNPVTSTVQLFTAPKNLAQHARRAALVANICAKGHSILKKRDQLTGLGNQLGDQVKRELPAIRETLRGGKPQIDPFAVQGVLANDPAWRNLKDVIGADLAAGQAR